MINRVSAIPRSYTLRYVWISKITKRETNYTTHSFYYLEENHLFVLNENENDIDIEIEIYSIFISFTVLYIIKWS